MSGEFGLLGVPSSAAALLRLDVDVVDILDLPIAEFPDHGAEDGSTTNTLVRGLVDALAG